jgi:hypothetical protein
MLAKWSVICREVAMTDAWRRRNEWGTLTRVEIVAARDAGALPVLTVGAAGAYFAPIFAAGDVGYVGDPAAFTVAAGEAMIDATVAALATCFADFARTQVRAGAP